MTSLLRDSNDRSMNIAPSNRPIINESLEMSSESRSQTAESVGSFHGVTVSQVEKREAVKPHTTSFASRYLDQVLEMGGNGFVTLEIPLFHDPQKTHDEYQQQFNNSSDETERAALKDVIQILQDTISYKNSFLQEEQKIASRQAEAKIAGANDKSVAATTTKALIIRGPILEGNISRLMRVASEVKELHEQARNLRLLIAELGLTPEVKKSLEAALEKTEIAISDRLLFAQHVKQKNFSAAKSIRLSSSYLAAKRDGVHAQERFYLLRLAKANAAGRQDDIMKLDRAVTRVKDAAFSFKKAAETVGSERVQQAWILSGIHYLGAAEANAVGREEDADRFKAAGTMERDAVKQFSNADGGTSSKEKQKIWALLGNYSLGAAKAILEKKKDEIERFKQATEIARKTFSVLEESDRSFLGEKEKEAYALQVKCYLAAAQATLEGRPNDAKQKVSAAEIAQKAVASFRLASVMEDLETGKETHLQEGYGLIAQAQQILLEHAK